MKFQGTPSEISSQADELCLADYAERPLRLVDRPRMTGCQKLWTGIFYAQLVFQFLLGVAMYNSRNVFPADTGASADGACPAGYIRHSDQCLSPELTAKRMTCLQARNEHFLDENAISSRRRLDGEKKSNKVTALLARHSRLPATTIFVASMLCVAMLFALSFAAGCVTWGMFVFNGLLMLYGFYLTNNWMLLVAVAVIAALTLWRKDDIQAAIVAMKVGAEALQATPVVFLLCAAIQLVWFVYAVIFMWTSSFSMPGSYDIGPSCDPDAPSLAVRLFMATGPFLFIVTTMFFRHCILAICSMAVGAWSFPEETAHQGFTTSAAATLGLELAFSTSCGSVFVASVILGVVDYLRKKVMNSGMLSWVDPTALVARMLWCALESTIGSLTRFALIGHMFQGDGLCHVASITGDMLQRRLPGILICGIVSEKVMRQLAMMGATGVGFFVWFWLDSTENYGFFSKVKSVADAYKADGSDDPLGNAGGTELMVILLTLLMLWCVRNPVGAIIVAYLFASFDFDSGWVSSFLISVVLASFVAVIFNYFASVLEYSTDTAFYCMALEAESSKRNIRLQPLHEIAQKRAEEAAEADNNA